MKINQKPWVLAPTLSKTVGAIAPTAGLSLERVPRVPGTRKILSSYVMAPVNFNEISREQLPGTHRILRPLIRGTRGLNYLTTALLPGATME